MKLRHGLSMVGLLTLTLAWGTVVFSPTAHAIQEESNGKLALQAQAIFKKSCAVNGCHPPTKFNANKRDEMVAAGVIKPRDLAGSKVIQRVESGNMPLGGDKLSDAEIKTLRDWIKIGAPDWAAASTKPQQGNTPQPQKTALITEKQLLQAIVSDLQNANERERPFLRYYSLANLANNPDMDKPTLARYRTSLSKLVNHLSWNQSITVPKVLGPEQTLLRIDMRDFDWTPAIWRRIVAAYPYGVRPRGLGGEVDQIRTLSGAELPYIRVDWFVANASVPPLYHDILQLPQTYQELEKRLNVDSVANLANEKCVRGGVRNSGVSRSNRVVERHRSSYGAYWKSYDFATNAGPKNIFLNPLNFREDGGEFIFNLPNGLQGYLIAGVAGKRLDEAPISIVRDRNNGGDNPVVRNGRACMGCHSNGMKTFKDEVRPAIETQQKADFDLDHALAVYRPQTDLDALFLEDIRRFRKSVEATGSLLSEKEEVELPPAQEPIYQLGNVYESDVPVAQAAADVGLTVKDFQTKLARNSELEKLGFTQLQGANGGIKRDLWEENFGTVVEELRLGDYIKPSQFRREHAGTQEDDRPTVTLGTFRGDQSLARQVQQGLFVLLNQSQEIRLVSGRADNNLRGEVNLRGDTLTLSLSDSNRNIREEALGKENELNFLIQQLATRIHLRITGSGLDTATAPPTSTRNAPPITADFGTQVQQAVGTGGNIRVVLSVAGGPGAKFRSNEDVPISFKVDKDCFVQLISVGSDGKVVNLFPNEHFPEARVQAGRVYNMVDDKGKPIIFVDPNGTFGLETVFAFATDEQGRLPEPRAKDLGLRGKERNEFTQDIRQKARGGNVSTAVVRFFTVK